VMVDMMVMVGMRVMAGMRVMVGMRLCWLARSSGMVAEMVFPECSRFEST